MTSNFERVSDGFSNGRICRQSRNTKKLIRDSLASHKIILLRKIYDVNRNRLTRTCSRGYLFFFGMLKRIFICLPTVSPLNSYFLVII